MFRYAEYMSKTFGPQAALMLLKPAKFGGKAAELLHLPADLIPSEDEWKQLQQYIMQIAAQQFAQSGAQAPAAGV
jgi:hypothetical protein